MTSQERTFSSAVLSISTLRSLAVVAHLTPTRSHVVPRWLLAIADRSFQTFRHPCDTCPYMMSRMQLYRAERRTMISTACTRAVHAMDLLPIALLGWLFSSNKMPTITNPAAHLLGHNFCSPLTFLGSHEASLSGKVRTPRK